MTRHYQLLVVEFVQLVSLSFISLHNSVTSLRKASNLFSNLAEGTECDVASTKNTESQKDDSTLEVIRKSSTTLSTSAFSDLWLLH